MTSWNPLGKKTSLTVKPSLSQDFATHLEDREMEIAFTNLQGMEENTKKLYKEVKKYEECIYNLHKLERKIASDLSNSPVCQDDDNLRKICEDYQSVVYQMGHITEDLVQLSQSTVVEPMKKISSEFASITTAIKKRNAALLECQKFQSKLEKLSKLEKTGTNIVKTETTRKDYLAAKSEFDAQNKLLLLELPQFYEKRINYFQPSLQALIQTQLDYYGETTGRFRYLLSSNPDSTHLISSEKYDENFHNSISELKALSIVGS